MARLIEADALIAKITDFACNPCKEKGRDYGGVRCRACQYGDEIEDIESAEELDAVPVVHGHWIFGVTMHREWMKCSECLVSQTPNGCFTYCPNCGAMMDGETEDDE